MCKTIKKKLPNKVNTVSGRVRFIFQIQLLIVHTCKPIPVNIKDH